MSPTKLVVAMLHRTVHIYELENLLALCSHDMSGGLQTIDAAPWQVRESAMKYQIRAVACMPNDGGYAMSSVEGRVAVEFFDPSATAQKQKYAFKCHRQTLDGEEWIYPVHRLAFHPVHSGNFASGGGDGVVALWDGVAKRRIRQYQKFPESVESMAFSSDGKYLAVGSSPGEEDNDKWKKDIQTMDMDGKNKIFIRELGDDEAKGKPKKEK